MVLRTFFSLKKKEKITIDYEMMKKKNRSDNRKVTKWLIKMTKKKVRKKLEVVSQTKNIPIKKMTKLLSTCYHLHFAVKRRL